jgi:hypothetical protein
MKCVNGNEDSSRFTRFAQGLISLILSCYSTFHSPTSSLRKRLALLALAQYRDFRAGLMMAGYIKVGQSEASFSNR